MSNFIVGVDEKTVTDLIQGGSHEIVQGTVEVAKPPYTHFYSTVLEGRKFLLALPPEAEATRTSEHATGTEWRMAADRNEAGVIQRVVAIEHAHGSREFANVISQLHRSGD